MSSKDDFINFFEKLWSANKAKGLSAQVMFDEEFRTGSFSKHVKKSFSGCWLLSPKGLDSHKLRHCFFISPKLQTAGKEVDPNQTLERSFFTLCEFMGNAGLEVVYVTASTDNGDFDFEKMNEKDYSSIKWNFYLYEKERLVKKSVNDIFGIWTGRGRPTYRKDRWDDESINQKFQNMPTENLESLLLNELFYTAFLKTILKKPANDPYDIDAFVVSLSMKHVLPVELKEKFPILKPKARQFGIDAGRILMLLRICLANDSNALYIVRELDEETRNFVGWKYIPLSKILMSASWQVQGGGFGMVGRDTHTVMLPYDDFEELTESTLDDENLKKLSDLLSDIKSIVTEYKQYFGNKEVDE